MAVKRCTKGLSCGGTCIDSSERCVLELGPIVNNSVTKVRDKLRIGVIREEVRANNAPGWRDKFKRVQREVEQDVASGKALKQQGHLNELRDRLKKEGLIKASGTPEEKEKTEKLGDLFAKQIQAGKEQENKSLPNDLKNQLWQLGKAEETIPSPPSSGKWDMDSSGRTILKTSDMLDDISRIMRGESPRNLQIASAGDELGMRARAKPTEVRKVERQLESALGSRAKGSMNLDQMREAAAKQANELSLQREKATGGAERKALKVRIEKLEAAVKRADELNATATGNTRWARVEAKDFDNALGKVRREGDTSYKGWSDSYGSGATKIGEGSYGTVIRNKDGTFVKRGDISDTEAELIKRLGKIDLGPKLIAADINGPAQYHTETSVDMKNGRIAMGQVPGKPIGTVAAPNTQIGGKNAADIYWKAMADLHRQGIAHNDAHIDNILVDDKGKGRWVDLGLAQASPKAALAEAMGIFKPLKGGDEMSVPKGATGEGNWQTARWNATGVSQAERLKREGKWADFQERFPVASRVWDNQEKVVKKMEGMGMDVNEINSVINHGIRSSPESYAKSDGFSRITDAQAQDLVNTLYDGI